MTAPTLPVSDSLPVVAHLWPTGKVDLVIPCPLNWFSDRQKLVRLSDAQSTITALEEKCARLEVEARRYRCLRHSLSGQASCSHTKMPAITDPSNSMLTYLPRGLDEALDAIIAERAAMKEQTP